MEAFGPDTLGLLVALGGGLLIGLERERRKGSGDDRRAAGIRSFTVTALIGALAQSLGGGPTGGLSGGLGGGLLVVLGGTLIVALVAVAYFKSRSRDPGITTELALFATYLVGVQSIISPATAAACAAGLAALLAARGRLHRFATHLMSERELHDGLLLASLALVVLPLIPSVPLTWLGGINPRPLAAMVLLILVLQAMGHVALRLLGPRGGVAAAGFFGGFVSSTATIASMGATVRQHPASRHLTTGGAALSTAATWVQVMVLATALSPPAARTLAPVVGAGLLGAVVSSAVLLWLAGRQAASDKPPSRHAGALSLPAALLIAALLTVVTVAVTSAQRHFGSVGVMSGAAFAGLVDAHSPVASLCALFAGGGLTTRELVVGVMLAISANSVTRVVTAFVAGGGRYGASLAAVLLAGLSSAWAAAYWVG
ncbi:MAG: DUF4010 domain-containing protein [Cytophagales bacterium]|nr:DUF4010 domain-containing protein [Rhizobacter sp.]